MGGRLSDPINNAIQAFPRFTWRDEFEKAAKCGFDTIEWVFDLYDKNPICSNEGLKEIKNLSEKHEIKIDAICADYFMEKKLFDVSKSELEKNLDVLKKLIENCHYLGIKILEIPLVDSSSLKNKSNEDQLLNNLQKVLPHAEKNSVLITLESDLSPAKFKELLIKFDHPNIRANYDVGNSASLGYDVTEELKEIGPWVSHIHIKDRIFRGVTVPLGMGDANFDLFFSSISKINYGGDFIIQGARELNVKPENTCKSYLKFVKQYVDKYL
jgi:hexulose-6-phosphate isomerase